MTTSTCSRSWEAEASRDGRLSRRARARFAQHCATCAACRETVDGLDALAEQLRAANPAVDEMAARRFRQKVLRSANGLALSLATERHRSWSWKVGAGVIIGALALALGLLHALSQRDGAAPEAGFGSMRSAQPPEPTGSAPAASGVLVEERPGAVWGRRLAGDREEITLAQGTLSLDVRHPTRLGSSAASPLAASSTPEPRVIVRVPDGEILDLGTRFRVVVQHNQTAEIAVAEGAVLFQRPGFADVRVEQGSTWRARADGTSAASTSLSRANSRHQSAPVAAAAAPPPPTPAARTLEQASHAKPPSNGTGTVASEDAARAAEDAAYLNWISLLHARRHTEARKAALDYLRDFPNGFRRAEVQAAVAPLTAPPARTVGPARE
jgi:FecR protein